MGIKRTRPVTRNVRRRRRHLRIKARIFGTGEKPRLCVYRSLNHIYGRLIDDEQKKTILSVSDLDLSKKNSQAAKTDISREVGKLIAVEALKRKIQAVIFDRGGYKYHGRVKALAEGAREAGLKF